MSENLVKNNVGSPKESYKIPRTVDLKDIELVFGTPAAPKGPHPDVHFITNEKKHGKHPHNNNNNNHKHGESDTETTPTQPLLEPDRGRNKPPLAGPEIDDLDDEHHTDLAPYPGIDDGLLEPSGKLPGHDDGGEKHEDDGGDSNLPREYGGDGDGGGGAEDGKWPWSSTDETDGYPDGFNGLSPRFGVDDRPGSPIPGSIPDVNTYQQKKNLAQGMMDLALLSANANQLRYVLESSNAHPYYYPSLTFISLSIIFQVAVGVGLIMNSRYDVKDDKDICKADKINNMTVLGVFLVTVINVFITSFSVATPNAPNAPVAAGGQLIQQAG